MQRVDFFWRRAQAVRNHHWDQVGDLLGRLLLAEVELTVDAEQLAENHDRVGVRSHHGLRLVSGQEAHLDAELLHELPIILRRRDDDLQVVVHELPRVEACGAKVDQHQSSRLLVIQEVRPVGVGLHAAEFEELQEAQLHDHLGDVVPVFLTVGWKS